MQCDLAESSCLPASIPRGFESNDVEFNDSIGISSSHLSPQEVAQVCFLGFSDTGKELLLKALSRAHNFQKNTAYYRQNTNLGPLRCCNEEVSQAGKLSMKNPVVTTHTINATKPRRPNLPNGPPLPPINVPVRDTRMITEATIPSVPNQRGTPGACSMLAATNAMPPNDSTPPTSEKSSMQLPTTVPKPSRAGFTASAGRVLPW
jgi:hypothetical protein